MNPQPKSLNAFSPAGRGREPRTTLSHVTQKTALIKLYIITHTEYLYPMKK